MKLLGLRVCEHDSNISYFDGDKVRYLKTERKYKIKHHGLNDLQSWKDIIQDEWNVKSTELDEIAIIVDPWIHGLSCREDKFFPSKPFYDINANCQVTRVNHHYAHHLSCWPLIDNPHKIDGIVMDGFGDFDCAWTVFKNSSIKETGSKNSHGSIGWHMSNLKHSFDLDGMGLDIAGKVMSLQSYGKLDKEFYEYLHQFDIKDINHIFNTAYYSDKWTKKINWLRTIHEYIGELLLSFIQKTFNKNKKIIYTGGVALNVNWNTKLKQYFNLIIPPHANDEGLSLGALEYLRIKHNLPKFSLHNFPYCQSDEAPDNKPNKKLIEKTADLIKQQKIIGWYQGHGEIGPRALGNRSILADARDYEMKNKVNLIKKRESFRPFGCSTVDNTFSKSLYMLYADQINKDIYPAVSHIDGTCRHQYVKQDLFSKLLHEYKRITDHGTLLNTSLNINGNPLASSIKEAVVLLENSELDGLVIGDELYLKS